MFGINFNRVDWPRAHYLEAQRSPAIDRLNVDTFLIEKISLSFVKFPFKVDMNVFMYARVIIKSRNCF